MRSQRWSVLAALLALPVVALFAACDDGDDSGEGESSAQAVLTALNYTSNAGLHGIDESINESGEIPGEARTVALRAQAVVEVTDWPDELADQADALADVFGEMAAALDGEAPDLEAAGEAAARAHDAEHEFSSAAWAYLQEEAGLEPPADGDHAE
jgi:hypothetical protein